MLMTLEGSGPLRERLFRGLRRAIVGGRIPPGGRLPSTRELADDLAVSRNVVLAAVARLIDEGYATTRVGAGTFAATTIPDASLLPWRSTAPPRVASSAIRFSARAQRLLDHAPLPAPGAPASADLRIDFRYGVPAFADFPHEVWVRTVTAQARRLSVKSLQYGAALGYPPLRAAIADYVTRARGVATTADRVLIVNGTQHGLSLLAQLLLQEGDDVVVEEPSYQAARLAFLAAGARLVPVPVDADGLDTRLLPRDGRARVAYVTPSHQFPLGGIMPRERRVALLQWAARYDAVIIEDDYDSEYRYQGQPVEAIQGLDRAGRVAYVGTFSKALFPAMRVGYLVLPSRLVPAVAALRYVADYHTPLFEQAVLAEFMMSGHFERHVRRSRARNARRRSTLLESLATHLGKRVEVGGANAGLHVVAWLRDVPVEDLDGLVSRAATARLGIYPVAPYYLQRPPCSGLLLGYANLTPEAIAEGVAQLASLILSRNVPRRRHRTS